MARDNANIAAVGPDLWSLLAVPAEGHRILSSRKLCRDLHKVHDVEVKALPPELQLFVRAAVERCSIQMDADTVTHTKAVQARQRCVGGVRSHNICKRRLKLRLAATILRVDAAPCHTLASWNGVSRPR